MSSPPPPLSPTRLWSRWRASWSRCQTASTRLQIITAALIILMAILVGQAIMARACTTIIVGKKATVGQATQRHRTNDLSKSRNNEMSQISHSEYWCCYLLSVDGSVMTTHNNDCEDCDVRIGVVPATINKPGTLCPIHPCGFDFPRYVGFDRGSTYFPSALEFEGLDGPKLPMTKPLGHIPEVRSTYRYLDGTYGMMNEHSLAIGESTCGAKIVAYSKEHGGDALFDISALTRLALQRCATAVCAVELIGSLAEEYGYAGSEDPIETGTDLFEEAGEALTIIDAKGEAWVFHILADQSGASAIWAAQRVSDEHLAVIPNKFIIDKMNLSDTTNFMASKDIRLKAIKAGFLKEEEDNGDEAFEFSRAFALDYTGTTVNGSESDQLNNSEGERRRWRTFSLVAPSRGFDSDQKDRFPFSVQVEKKLAVEDIQRLMRDHFEGTPFDATKGLAAGPYGNPNRFDRNSEEQPEVRKGFFERTISIHRTSYSFVAVAHPQQPASGVLWFAHHSPQNSLYLPLFSATLTLPPSFARGTLFKLSRKSAWWAFAAVANNAERMYQPIHEVIAQRQNEYELESRTKVLTISQNVQELKEQGNENEAIEIMTEFTTLHSEQVRFLRAFYAGNLVERWWYLLDELTAMFRDGLLLKSTHPPLELGHIFYPVWWLKEVGYFSRGELSLPNYPPVPQPKHLITTQQITPTSEPSLSESRPMTTNQLVDESESFGDSIDDTSTSTSSHPSPHPLTANWLTNDRKLFITISIFIVVLILVSLVFFQFGRMWAERQAGFSYSEILDQEAGNYPTGGGRPTTQDQARSRHSKLEPPAKVVMANR